MPVGWGGDVYDIHVGVVDELAEVVVGFQLFAPFLLGSREGGVKVLLVNVAESNETALLVADEV